MKTPRVLHAIPTMESGGAERQLAWLAGDLRFRGWDVHVALLRGGRNLETLHGSGATIHMLTAAGHHDPRIAIDLAALARRLRPDVLQTWMPQMDVFGAMAAAVTGTPHVLTERSDPQNYTLAWKRRLRSVAGRYAAAIVANAPVGQRYWQTLLPGMSKVMVIPNGLPLDCLARTPPADPATLGLPRGVPLVAYAGRFSSEKNPAALVEALAQVMADRPCAAILCGEGPQLDEIKARIAQLGLSGRVACPGFVSPVWGWFKRAHVLVAPSVFEGHPNAVLEAMACGCPLVVSDIEAHRDFLSGELATFVNPHDPKALAGAIRTAIDQDHVTGEIQRARLQAHAQRWSLAAAADQYDRLYRRIAEIVPTQAQVSG